MVEKYKCPKCGIKKPFEMFGRRLMNGSTLARQSYCTKCRGLKSTRRKTTELFGKSPSIDDMPEVKTVTMDPLPIEDGAFVIDKDAVLKLYRKHYPNDNQYRSYKTKLQRLKRKGVL